MNGLYIPVAWIYEQIKKNPGRHASSWNYLLDLWDKKLLKDIDDEKTDSDAQGSGSSTEILEE